MQLPDDALYVELLSLEAKDSPKPNTPTSTVHPSSLSPKPIILSVNGWHSAMSGPGMQMFGFVSSVIATVGSVGALYVWLTDALPSAKMRVLDALLSETEALLRSALEEGIMDYHHYETDFSTRLWAAKLCADEYRAQVYTIKSRTHELVHWMSGLSGNIGTVVNDLCVMRGQIAVSSSRGRQRLDRMGQTANLTLEKYAQRDTLSLLTLPNPPDGVACTLKPCTVDDMMAPPQYTATSLSSENVPTHPSPAPQLSAVSATLEILASTLSADLKAHPLPPLAFRSKDKTVLGGRRVIGRISLHPFGKQSTTLKGDHSGHQERRGFPGPFRIFSGLFQRSSDTLPATASSPVTASLQTSPPSEKGDCLHAALWEQNAHVAVQVKLPV